MKKPNGYILWEGLSPLDNQPIVLIATLKTSNRKTGDMIQTWILRQDINPVEAVNNGQDYSICGNCPHRKKSYVDDKGLEQTSRSCYVNVGQAPNSIYKAYKAGKYPVFTFSEHGNIFKDRNVRFGAYGDPALIPEYIVRLILMMCKSHTGYTHQWRRFQNFAGIFMASCDNEHDRCSAQMLGFKTFTVIGNKNSAPNYAKQCPATVANSVANCATCKLCDGAKRDIFVHAHGSGAKYI